jgi:hypothetical protein
VPAIDLDDAELTALVAAERRCIADDKYPHASRLRPITQTSGVLGAATVLRFS